MLNDQRVSYLFRWNIGHQWKHQVPRASRRRGSWRHRKQWQGHSVLRVISGDQVAFDLTCGCDWMWLDGCYHGIIIWATCFAKALFLTCSESTAWWKTERERKKTATRKDGKAMRKIRFMLRHQDMVDMVVPASGFLNMSEGCQGWFYSVRLPQKFQILSMWNMVKSHVNLCVGGILRILHFSKCGWRKSMDILHQFRRFIPHCNIYYKNPLFFLVGGLEHEFYFP